MSDERGRIVRPVFVLVAWSLVLIAYVTLVVWIVSTIASAS